MNLLHVMVDVESVGAGPCAIGAVIFDPRGDGLPPRDEAARNFHRRISIASLQKVGLRPDGETVEWWMGQSEEARQELTGTEQVHVVLNDFAEWIGAGGRKRDEVFVWAWPPAYDVEKILNPAFRAVGVKVPWIRRNQLDARTICVMLNCPDARDKSTDDHTKAAGIDEGEPHVSLSDARAQARLVQLAMRNTL